MPKETSYDLYNNPNRVCNKCGEPAKFFDGSNNQWWCGMTMFAHGYCKNERKK